MIKQKILVVDDEPDLIELVSDVLEQKGYAVSSAGNVDAAMKKMNQNRPDLIILDLNLPGIDGVEFCRILKGKNETKGIPVIMLTVQSSHSEKIRGLETGADDYITKPFNSGELLARVKAVLRRGLPEEPRTLAAGNIFVDLDKHVVLIKNKKIGLTPKEYDLLCLLMEKKGKVLSRQFLTESICGYDYFGTRTIDVHIRHLREKLGNESKRIQTVETAGYRFSDEE